MNHQFSLLPTEDTEVWRLARACPGRDVADAQLALVLCHSDFARAARILRLPLFDVACGRTHIKLAGKAGS